MRFYQDLEKVTNVTLSDKLLVGRNSDGSSVYMDVQTLYDRIAQTYFVDTKPSVIAAGSVLTNPNSLTCYIAPAGSYTTPAGTITLSGNLNLIFWDFDSGWTYTSFDVAVKDNTVSTSKIVDLAVTTAKIADGAVTTAKIADKGINYHKLAQDIVAYIESKGLDVETYKNAEYWTDNNGNVIVKIDENGLNTTKYILTDNASGRIKIIDSAFILQIENMIDITSILQYFIDVETYKNAEYWTDNNGNVIAKIDENGLNTTKYNICDANGNIVATLTADLLQKLVTNIKVLTSFNTDSRYLNGFYVVDSATDKPYVGMKYDQNGLDVAKLSDHFKSLLPIQQNSKITNQNYYADINMCIVYGQSLAVGGNTISGENFYTANMFQQGVLITANTANTLTEANTESIQATRFGSVTTMNSSGNGLNGRILTKKWNELIRDENGKVLENFPSSLMGFVAGVSGGQWFQLSKWNYNRTIQYVANAQKDIFPTALQFGTNNEGRSYLNLLQGVYFAKKQANAQGKTFNVPVLCWVQGEASSDYDDTVSEYQTKLTQIFDDLNSDIKALTGQSNDVQFIIYQNSSFSIYQVPTSPSYIAGLNTEGVPLACLKIAREKENVIFGTPLYPYSVSQSTTDKLHLSNIGYAMMSSMFGLKAKRTITDQAQKITFYPKATETFSDGTNYFVKVKFDVPVKPLVFDVSGDDGTNMRGHGLQPNFGFSILSSGTEIITAVRLSADDSVVITCNQNPNGKDLTYAWTGVLGGGNLRDSQGDTITTTFNSVTYRLDNWCPFFRITI